MTISTRDDLKHYCLRKLGSPVMQINVTPDQIEDCIDDALIAYWEWHHEGSFLDFVSRPLTQEEIDAKEFTVDPWIYQVLGIMMLGGYYSEYNLQYQSFMQGLGSQFIRMGSRQDGAGMVSYVVTQSYLSMVRDFFMPEKRVQFNQRHDKIHIHSRMTEMRAGDYLVLEVYRLSDPNTYRETWNDWWLKAYTTSLIKRQWGMNMLKYSGFTMPSGITLNGRDIYSDALAEIEKLETQLITTESTPPDFFVG